jgi:hypothetical protein
LAQILIAKGASLTFENANGYAFTSYDFIVVSNGNCSVSQGCNLYSSYDLKAVTNLFFSFWYYDFTSVLFYLMLFYCIYLTFTCKKMFYFLVEFNVTRAIGDFTPCSRTLVY